MYFINNIYYIEWIRYLWSMNYRIVRRYKENVFNIRVEIIQFEIVYKSDILSSIIWYIAMECEKISSMIDWSILSWKKLSWIVTYIIMNYCMYNIMRFFNFQKLNWTHKFLKNWSIWLSKIKKEQFLLLR